MSKAVTKRRQHETLILGILPETTEKMVHVENVGEKWRRSLLKGRKRNAKVALLTIIIASPEEEATAPASATFIIVLFNNGSYVVSGDKQSTREKRWAWWKTRNHPSSVEDLTSVVMAVAAACLLCFIFRLDKKVIKLM